MALELCGSSLNDVEEHSTLAIEGTGSSLTWRDTDPERLQMLFAGAVERLSVRWPNAPKTPTDSDDGAETIERRHMAHTRRVLAAFDNWKRYESYRMDFESESVLDPVLLNLRQHCHETCLRSHCNPVFARVFITLAEFLGMRDVLASVGASHSLHFFWNGGRSKR